MVLQELGEMSGSAPGTAALPGHTGSALLSSGEHRVYRTLQRCSSRLAFHINN